MSLHAVKRLSGFGMALLSTIVLLSQPAIAALLPEDVSCVQQGGFGGTCFYDSSACATPDAANNSDAANSNGVTIDNTAAQQAAQKASTGGTNVGYALYDSTGKLLANYNDTFENYSASITKSMILVAYLNQVGSGTLSAYATTNLTGMIEQSVDQDSNNVLGLLNNPSKQINAVAQAAGMTGFKLNLTGDAVYNLGQSQITANDFAKFFSKIDTMFPASQKSFALNLLSNITPQAGLLRAGLPGTVYSKEGWKPEPGTVDDHAVSGSPDPFGIEGVPYIVNQAAQFSSGGTTYGIAVTVGGTESKPAGEAIIKGVVSALINESSPSPTPADSSQCCSGSGSTPLGGPDGSGPLYGLKFPAVANTQDLANRIDQYIKSNQPNSPFVGLGDKFVEAGIKYDVNPAMMIGFAVKEQSLGTASDPEDDNNHNSFGISGNNPGQDHQYPVQNGATYYPSFAASIPEAADYISAGYIKQGAPFYATTLLGLMEHYTPNEAGQSSQQQTQLTLDVEHKILNGIATTGGVSSDDDSPDESVPTGCGGSGTTDCSTVTGDAKILCAAQPYAGIYYEYGGGHQGYSNFIAGCPDPSNPPNNQPTGGQGIANGDPGGNSGNPSPCATDCSALVSIAVDSAFGQTFNWTVATLATDAQDWKAIPINTVQPGDVVTIQTSSDQHVEIVDHYDKTSGVLYTFGSHKSGTKTGGVSSTLASWTGAYRYIGPGSGN